MRMKKAEPQLGMWARVHSVRNCQSYWQSGDSKASGCGFGRLRSCCYWNRLGEALVDSQPIGFFLNHGIALARELFEPLPVQHRNDPARVGDHAQLLQLAGGVGDTLAAYAQHVRDELLRHG